MGVRLGSGRRETSLLPLALGEGEAGVKGSAVEKDGRYVSAIAGLLRFASSGT